MYRHERRTGWRRLSVGQAQRRLLAGNLSSEEDDAVVVRDNVWHLLDEK